MTFDRKDKLPCYKAKRGSKKCASCTSGACSFTSPPPPPSTGPKSYIQRAMGMLEGLSSVEADPKKKEALDRVFAVLESGSAE